VKPVDIAKPLEINYDFITYTLTTRHGENDTAFSQAVNSYDFPPASIFFHGVHALYRMIQIIDDPDLGFREIDMPRKENESITEELMQLYKENIDAFIDRLSHMTEEDLEKKIPSPLNGNPIRQQDWFAQSIMHTIHHVGQAVRLQGMVDRQLNNHPVSYESPSDYTNLFS